MYEYGEGVAQDYLEAAKWYRKAAKQGFSNAQFKIGRMYDQGKGVRQDSDTAAEWLEKAAKRGNEKARFYLKFM
jgi:hypothetical protein